MRKRPIEAYIMMLFFLGISVAMPLQIIFLYNFEWSEYKRVFQMLTPMNYVIVAFSLLNVYLWKDVQKMTIFLTSILGILVVFNNYYIGKIGYDYQMSTVMYCAIAFVVFNVLIMNSKNIKLLIKNPSKRWWLQSKRIQVEMPIEIYTMRSERKKFFYAQNISQTGALISTSDSGNHDLKHGEELDIRMPLGKLRHVHCRAKVVRKAHENQSSQEKSYGIIFTHLDQVHEKNYKRFYHALAAA